MLPVAVGLVEAESWLVLGQVDFISIHCFLCWVAPESALALTAPCLLVFA
jgi:hypothetical protein